MKPCHLARKDKYLFDILVYQSGIFGTYQLAILVYQSGIFGIYLTPCDCHATAVKRLPVNCKEMWIKCWPGQNKWGLGIYEIKIESMYFSNGTSNILKLMLGSKPIRQMEKKRYLGCMLDEKLSLSVATSNTKSSLGKVQMMIRGHPIIT